MRKPAASLTIIIPVYNGAREHIIYKNKNYLDLVLPSIIEQKEFLENNTKILLVDDCSTDNSIEIINGYIKKYPSNISLITKKENTGPGQTKWTGIINCKTDYFYIIDCDDKMNKNSLKTLYKYIPLNLDLVIFPKWFIKTKVIKLKDINIDKVVGFMSTHLHKTSIVVESKFDKYITETHDDVVFGPLLRLYEKKIAICKKRIFTYTGIVSSSMQRSIKSYKFMKKSLRDFSQLLNMLADNKIDSEYIKFFWFSYKAMIQKLKSDSTERVANFVLSFLPKNITAADHKPMLLKDFEKIVNNKEVIKNIILQLNKNIESMPEEFSDSEPICLYYGIDKGLFIQTFTSLISLFENNKNNVFKIYFLEAELPDYLKYCVKISNKQKQALIDLIKNANKKNEVTFLDTTDLLRKYMLTGPNDNWEKWNRTKTSLYYQRYLIAFFPNIPDKIIWMDSDTLVLRNIRELYDINLNGFAWAGRKDKGQWWNGRWYHGKFLQNGVMLLNMKDYMRDFFRNTIINFKTVAYGVAGDMVLLNNIHNRKKISMRFADFKPSKYAFIWHICNRLKVPYDKNDKNIVNHLVTSQGLKVKQDKEIFYKCYPQFEWIKERFEKLTGEKII